MDIDKLRSFLVLAEVKNFTKASEQLYISQPALTKQIQSLEMELGVPLFNRINKKTFLTVEGTYLVNYAYQTIASYNNAIEYIKQIQNMEEGTLNFGATNFIGVYLMPKMIARFQKMYPNITIDMRIDSSIDVMDKLKLNQLEFAFISDYIHHEDEKYETINFKKDNLKLIVGRDHKLFNRKKCTLDEIKNDLYITKDYNSSQTKFIKKILDKENFKFQKELFISNQEAIKESVIYNMGISIISTSAVEREVDSGYLNLVDIEGVDITRDIHCVHLKKVILSPAAKEFLRMLEFQVV